jgi:hypothetical protein
VNCNSLRMDVQYARCPEWGVRDLEEVASIAVMNGLALETTYDTPENNLTVIFRKK